MTQDSSAATVAVDVMGADLGPAEMVAGALDAVRADPSLNVILVGGESEISGIAPTLPPRTSIEDAPSVVDMAEHPAKAVRDRPDSSVAVSARLVKEGRAGAFVSAGNTGAALAAALLYLGRIPGIARPAIVIVLPTPAGPVVFLDAGANADTKAEHMGQFGVIGSAYASCLLGIDSPRVGLLNIGEEETKGSMLYQDSHLLLSRSSSLRFIGNVEGRQLFEAKADVVVADGFVGNIVLKILEGFSEMLFSQLKSIASSSAGGKIGGSLLAPRLRELKAKLDYEEYGGAQLLGLKGGCVIAHGGSKAKAIANAVAVGASMIRTNVVEAITTQVGQGGRRSTGN